MKPRRYAASAVVALVALCVAWDLGRRPGRQWTAALLVGAIHLYQRSLSPALEAAGVECRFEPTCSRYAAAVIARDGTLRGSWRAARRLARCGPWTPAATRDPP